MNYQDIYANEMMGIKQPKYDMSVMKLAHKKIEKIDEGLRNKPLWGGNLLYITQMRNY